VDLLLERYRSLLKVGTILVAEADESEDPRALVYLEHAIQNGRTLPDGRRELVSKQLQFVEVTEDWEADLAGYAPYLDYRASTPDELALIRPLVEADWLDRGLEQAGLDYAIREAVPRHLADIEATGLPRLEQTREAVQSRLVHEISYWDHRAQQLKDQELAGKQPRGGLNSGKARARADDLQERLNRRLTELDEEAQLSKLPPLVIGGALIVPRGLLDRHKGVRDGEPDAHARETERVERLAVDAVLEAERRLGNHPVEMPRNNPGYDIQSLTPEGNLRFIEVKGRVDGAQEFTITRTEILTSLNKPDQVLLALVSVGIEDATDVRYLRKPFTGTEETYFDMTSANYTWDELFARGEAPA
jgi:hypothetical protein